MALLLHREELAAQQDMCWRCITILLNSRLQLQVPASLFCGAPACWPINGSMLLFLLFAVLQGILQNCMWMALRLIPAISPPTASPKQVLQLAVHPVVIILT